MNDYFAARTVVTERGCWEWTLSRSRRGYGQAVMRSLYDRPVGAHRLAYELLVGPIPAGLTVDHLCFNPPCVNPEHLRLLSGAENSAHQLDSYKTHCKRGHAFTPENTRVKDDGNGKRDCKTCHRDRERGARTRRMADVPRKGLARGERSGRARLTDALVMEARERNAHGESVMALARELGVSRPTLQDAVQGKSWTHLPSAFRPQETA